MTPTHASISEGRRLEISPNESVDDSVWNKEVAMERTQIQLNMYPEVEFSPGSHAS